MAGATTTVSTTIALVTDPALARVIEEVDSRVLGAVRFADATSGTWITTPLQLSSATASFICNRSAVYAVSAATGLETNLASLDDPPPAADLGSIPVAVTVRDPSGRYLPRAFTLTLPRDPDPANAGNDGSLFKAARIALYPAPAAPTYPGWAVVRVSVKRAGTTTGVPDAWIRLRLATQDTAADPPLAAGMTDGRGEALVAVSGIPITNWDPADGGALMATDVAAVLEAYADAAASSPPDPDAINAKRATLPTASQPLQVASGRQSVVRLELTLP